MLAREDIDTEFVCKLAETADQCELQHSDPVGETLRLLAQERDQMRRALEPFSVMAGELFARNYDASDRVLFFKAHEEGGPDIVLDFADFLVVRDVLNNPIS